MRRPTPSTVRLGANAKRLRIGQEPDEHAAGTRRVGSIHESSFSSQSNTSPVISGKRSVRPICDADRVALPREREREAVDRDRDVGVAMFDEQPVRPSSNVAGSNRPGISSAGFGDVLEHDTAQHVRAVVVADRGVEQVGDRLLGHRHGGDDVRRDLDDAQRDLSGIGGRRPALSIGAVARDEREVVAVDAATARRTAACRRPPCRPRPAARRPG